MNDIGLSIEFTNYNIPWSVDYCNLADVAPSPYTPIVLTESGSIGVIQEFTGSDDFFSGSLYILLDSGSVDYTEIEYRCADPFLLESAYMYDTGSILLQDAYHTFDRFNLPYYGNPFFLNLAPTPAVYDSSSYSIGLEQSDYDINQIDDGVRIDSSVYFVPENEPKNANETYKRLIYSQHKNVFYNNPLESTDPKNKILYNKMKTVTIPQAIFGDKIVENSVEIVQNYGVNNYTIVDDGNGNLYTKDNTFSVIIDDQNKETFTSASNTEFFVRKLNMGYSVSVGNDYAAVGVPSFEETMPRLGYVEIYEYDKTMHDRFTYSCRLNRQTYPYPFPYADYSGVTINDDFGRSVDIYNNICAVSSTTYKYYYPVSSSEMYIDNKGLIEFYDLSTASSVPVCVVSESMLPCSYELNNKTFGHKISVNGDFLVVGCPYTYKDNDSSPYRGIVHIFSGDTRIGYEYHSSITGSDRSNDILFGRDLKIDKTHNKLVVGNGNYNELTGSKAYLFEFISGSWVETYAFSPVKKDENLNFVDVKPSSSFYGNPDGFGTSVSLYCSSSIYTTVVIGAPFDRQIIEYNGSSCYKNGAVYIHELEECIITTSFVSGSKDSGSIKSYAYEGDFKELRISGNELTLKNNRFGHSVDIHNDKIVVSSPKYLSEIPPDYLKNTFLGNLLTNPTADESYLGSFHVYKKDAIDRTWQMYATYKPRKTYGSPHCFYAYSVSTFNDNLLVGNPIVLALPPLESSGSWRTDIITYDDILIDIQIDKTNFAENLQGNFNIFNYSDYETQHHVGNVFYKSGKMVLSTSASVFDTIFETPVNDYPVYDINFNSKVTLYEKEVICTINPGEFNYSTNPTSYNYEPAALLDLNKNGKFDFDDCDKILRGMYYKFTETETWWDIFDNFSSTEDIDTIVEKSLFYFYLKQDLNLDVPAIIRLTDDEKSHIINNLNKSLDINGDGVSDYTDLKMIWKYFASHLTPNNIITYQTSKSTTGFRPKYDDVVTYLNTITGKNQQGRILDTFYSHPTGSTASTLNPTSSYLTPYITSIGLYNGADLIAVAKLGTPIKNLGWFPLNFIVRFDV